MPAVSKSQQRLFGIAYAVSKYKETDGEEGLDPNDLNSEYSEQIMKLVNSLDIDELKKFAKTKTKDLPNIKECLTFENFCQFLK